MTFQDLLNVNIGRHAVSAGFQLSCLHGKARFVMAQTVSRRLANHQDEKCATRILVKKRSGPVRGRSEVRTTFRGILSDG
jgi:hypothetical protein